MIKSLNIIICNFKNIPSLDDIANDLSESVKKESDSWYENIVYENETISGDFNSRRNTYIRQINPLSNTIEKTQTEIISSVYFVLDIENEILEFHGSPKDYSRFIKNLNKKTDIIDSLDIPTLNLNTFFLNLLNKNPELNLLNMTISDIRLNDSLIGKYQAKVSSDGDAIKLIEEYKEKITAIVISFPLKDDHANVSINVNGSYRVKCLDKNINHIINILKLTQKVSYA